jgi:aminomethyltransferase
MPRHCSMAKCSIPAFPTTKGGIVDDLLVYRISDEEYLLVVNASNIDKDWQWLSEINKRFGAQMHNISDNTSLLAVQGPKTAQALQSLTSLDLASMSYYTFAKSTFAGKDNCIISATGYTGAGGFEIYCRNEDASDIWDAVMAAGASFGIKPAGLAARDTLRLEMGFCLYGNDIDDTTSPIAAGLGWITKFTKEFTNSAALKAEKEAGSSTKLVGFELLERGIPRSGCGIADEAGNTIGRVTSGTMSPSLQKGIGMGYVNNGWHKEGSSLKIDIRGKLHDARVVKLPFFKG